MPRKDLSIPEESLIVALLARGDSHAQIIAQVEDRFGRRPAVTTIIQARKRNQASLDQIKSELMRRDKMDSQAIKDQANRNLKKHLDNHELALEVLAKAGEEYLDEKISLQEYTHIVKTVKVSTPIELVNISREMHNQSGAGDDTPTSKQDISKLVEAIESGDEVQLNQIVFKKGSNDINDASSGQVVSPDEASGS